MERSTDFDLAASFSHSDAGGIAKRVARGRAWQARPVERLATRELVDFVAGIRAQGRGAERPTLAEAGDEVTSKLVLDACGASGGVVRASQRAKSVGQTGHSSGLGEMRVSRMTI